MKKNTTTRSESSANPEERFAGFLNEFEPGIVSLTQEVHAKLRARLHGAVEMVYDNYNFLVVGFGASERPSEAVLSIVIAPRKVALAFLWGKGLPDPENLLQGTGNQVRNLRLGDATVLDRPPVIELIREAVQRSATPFDSERPNRMVIRSISAKRRPRRPQLP